MSLKDYLINQISIMNTQQRAGIILKDSDYKIGNLIKIYERLVA